MAATSTDFSRDVLVSLLRQGQNGDQLLQILDVVTSGMNVNQNAGKVTEESDLETAF